MSQRGSSSRSEPLADDSDYEHGVLVDEATDSGEDAHLKVIHWDIDGRPVGENSTEFRSKIDKLVKTIVSPHYESWPNVPKEVKQTLIQSLHGSYSFSNDRENFIEELAGTRLSDWRYNLTKKYIDTTDTIPERKRAKPAIVRQEDCDMFVDRVSNEDFGQSQHRGKTARSFSHSPHTTGRRGAAVTAELLRKENPDAKRINFFLATHVSKDMTAPTPEARAKIDEIKHIFETDPEARDRDLDTDAVAMVYGPDTRGRVRGMGARINKTTIQAAGGYRERLNSNDSKIRKLEKTVRKFMKQQVSQTSTGSGSSPQGPQEGSTPVIRTGLCFLRDGQMKLVAVASVLGATPGSTPERLQLQVQLGEIIDPSTLIFEGGGTTLGQHMLGDVIKWPAYFVSYAS